MKYKKLMAGLLLGVSSLGVHAEQIGSVDTVFKMFGPDHKIVVEAFDDPDVKNVTCYISRAKTGGIKGGLGLPEDTSDAAISCQQVGAIVLTDKRNALVYLTYSDKVVDGSPKNAISAVPIMPWGDETGSAK